MSALAEGLRAVGAEAEVVLREAHPFGYPADRVLGPLSRVAYGLVVGARRDVLHYQYGSTWLRGHLDARIARALGHVRVVTFHGDDCRLGAVAKELFPARGRVKGEEGDAATRARLAALAAVCDAAVVNDFELATYVGPYFDRVYLMPIPIGGPRPTPRRTGKPDGTPVIVHSPSHAVTKGTAEIVAAVNAVAERHPVDFRLLSGVPHAHVQAELDRADIVVDQLNSVQPGMFALESMRRGLPVLGEIDRSVFAPFQHEVPVVAVTAATLEGELESLVVDRARREEIGARGSAFVERVHAAPQVARAALAVYEHVRDAPPGMYVATPHGIEPVTPPAWVREAA